MVYYNELDPKAAAWLRELIRTGAIADGHVDERSIVEVSATDLAGFSQCHFFAGIGGWSYALRLAGWPDHHPVWTGSCPCQPFSGAGKGKGFDDARHLWPAFFRLIEQCRPLVVFGEQVASKDGLTWLDLVHADMENANYTIGTVDTCVAGFGAPHIRQRLYWVANTVSAGWPEGWAGTRDGQVACGSDTRGVAIAECSGLERFSGNGDRGDRPGRDHANEARPVTAIGATGGMADRNDERREKLGLPVLGRDSHHEVAGRGEIVGMADSDEQGISRGGIQGCEQSDCSGNGSSLERPTGLCADGGLADTCGTGLALGQIANDGRGTVRDEGPTFAEGGISHGMADTHRAVAEQPAGERAGPDEAPGAGTLSQLERCDYPGRALATDAVNGQWGIADWLYCRDGKWRAVEPGTFPLAHGLPARVGRLRGYGNAIVPQVAAEFIRAAMMGES